MKRTVKGVVAALMLTMAVSGAAFASEGVEIEAGAKIWANTGKVEAGGSSNTSDMALMVGPAVCVKFPSNVFVDASIMTTATKYKTDVSGTTFEVGRMDIDLAVGYSFIPNLGAYAGYRNIAFSGDQKSTTSGPLLGVRGAVPVNDAISIYGDFAVLMFTDKPDVGASEDAPGIGLELGVKYAISKTFDAGLGYKMEQTEGADSKVKSTFAGLNISAMFKF